MDAADDSASTDEGLSPRATLATFPCVLVVVLADMTTLSERCGEISRTLVCGRAWGRAGPFNYCKNYVQE